MPHSKVHPENATSLKFLFTFTSFFLIYEACSLYIYKQDLLSMKANFLTDHIALFIISTIIFGFVASTITPIISFFIRTKCNNDFSQFQKEYLTHFQLYTRALNNQSSIDYQLLKDHETEQKEFYNLYKLAILLSLSLIINACFNTSIINTAISLLNESFFYGLILAPVVFALGYFIFQYPCDSTDKVYYPDHKELDND